MAKSTKKPAAKHHHGRELRTLAHLVEFVLTLESQIMALDKTVTDALAAQDAKIADLGTKVDAFIAGHQTNSAADNAAIVSAVQAQGTAVDAIAAKLTPPTA